MDQSQNKFLQRLSTGKPLVMAEGYIFELEKRGYVSAGPFCPEVLLENPEVIKQITREFVRCGSEVILACTYYINRPKLILVGKPGEDILHKLNVIAIQIAKEIRAEPGNEHCLIAGDISNSTSYLLNDEESHKEVFDMFSEQARWAKEEGVDFILAETINSVGEALLALKAIKDQGLPAIINLAITAEGVTRDGYSIEDAFVKLKKEGADVVGANCSQGPVTILKYLERIRKVVDGPIAGVPVAYRTTEKQPTFFNLVNEEKPNLKAFPTALEPLSCDRYDFVTFAEEATKIGVQVLGICCGNSPHFTRALAETLGQITQASKYAPKMELHHMYGKPEILAKEYVEHGKLI